jgi:hypothetical protein
MNSDTSKPSFASVIAFLFGMLLICLCIYGLSTDNTPEVTTPTPKQTTTVVENQHVIVDTVWHYRIVKSVKVDNETSTSYHYKYDWLHGKFRQQPRIESETKYYIVYKDGGIEETTKEKGMFY